MRWAYDLIFVPRDEKDNVTEETEKVTERFYCETLAIARERLRYWAAAMVDDVAYVGRWALWQSVLIDTSKEPQ